MFYPLVYGTIAFPYCSDAQPEKLWVSSDIPHDLGLAISHWNILWSAYGREFLDEVLIQEHLLTSRFGCSRA